jgi:hypothetical protein
MIYALGLRSEATFAHFMAEAAARGTEVLAVDLRDAVEGEWVFPIGPAGTAELSLSGRSVHLQPSDAFYCRIISLADMESDPQRVRRWQALCTGLFAWINDIPGRVANRGYGGEHNSSKPLHEALLLRYGFSVPESVTTCDPAEITAFLNKGRTVSKTVCGVRADTTEVTDTDFAGFEPAAGPVHLQRLIEGDDARIHVVGNKVIAQRVDSPNIDYRTAGDISRLTTFVPEPAIAEHIVRASNAMGMAFTGWDFKIDAAGQYWCLEVNPMPGYGCYDRRCDGAISTALLRYLSDPAC